MSKKSEESRKMAKLYINCAYNGIPLELKEEYAISDEYSFVLQGLKRYRYVMTDDEYDFAVLALEKRMDLIRRR